MRKFTLLMALFIGILTGHSIAQAAPEKAKPLTVTTMQPTGEIQNLTQIVVRFSEDMRPLGQMEQDTATSPLKLTATAGTLPKGEFRWLDTSTLAYLFEAPVEAPIRITAMIEAGTKALLGNTLAQSVSWQINTPALSFSLSGTSGLPPTNAAVTLYTSYALDMDSLKSKTTLTMDGRLIPVEITQPETSGGEGYRGRRAGWQYTIRIKSALLADKTLTLSFAPGIALQKGGEPMPAHQFALSSYESLKITGWRKTENFNRKQNKKDNTSPPEAPVFISLNNPVTLADLLSHLDVSPKAARTGTNEDEDDSTREDYTSRSHNLPFHWEARTTYTLTVKPGLKDSYGTTLAKGDTFTFKTGDFSPMIQVEEGNKIMERPLNGVLPIDIRNISPVEIKVRHVGWNRETYKVWGPNHKNHNTLANITPLAEKTLNLDFSKNFNKNIRYNLDIPGVLGYASVKAMPAGLIEVFITVSDPDNLDRDGKPVKYTRYLTAQITNIGITSKTGVNEGLAWVTDITTGKPLVRAPVTLVDDNGDVLWQGATNDKGLVILPGRKALAHHPRYIVVRTDDDMSVLDTGENFGGTYHNNYDSIIRGDYWKVHAITQLPLYQPGQTVNYTLYARGVTGKSGSDTLATPDWRPIAGEKVKVVVKDSRYRDVHTQDATTNAYGSVSGSFTLSPEAAHGAYQFYITRADNNRTTSAYSFQVAVFRAPDFKVDLDEFGDMPNPSARAKPIAIGMKAAYFSGAALPGAAAIMKITRQNEPFTPERLAGYKTGTSPDNPWLPYYHGKRHYAYQPPETVAELPATLDANGAARFMLPDIAAAPGQPARIGMEVTVTDKSGLTTQGARNFLLHPSSSYIGIRAQRIMLKGQKQSVTIKGATWDNQPLSGVRVILKAERVRGNRQATGEPLTDPVWEKSVTLSSADGTTVPVAFDKSGTYHLIAIITDETGRENRSLTTVFVPGPGMDWISSRTGKALELLAEDIEYKPGDTARILIRNPFYDAAKGENDTEKHMALVTIERDSVKSHSFIEVSGATYPLELKLTEADAPYFFVSVVMIRGRTAAPPAINAMDNRDMGAPWARQGTQLIRVKKDEPKLLVTIETGSKQYQPGETVEAKIKVADTTRRTRQTQVTLLAVDNRILRAAGEKTPYNPDGTFEPVYAYGIYSTDTRLALLNLSQISPRIMGGMAQKMMAPMAAMSRSADMAEDARMAPAQGRDNAEPTLRQNFSPLAHWLAAGETDASGHLTTRFTLPDTLTSYRIVAIVADKTKAYGVREAEITATKPLQLLSAMPRFATEGDRMGARLLVQNTGSRQQTITVTAKATNMQLDSTTQTITLGAGKSGTVTFPATIGTPGNARLVVYGKMGRETDAAEFTFPIMPAAPLTTVAAAGLLKEGETRTVPVQPPGQLDPRSKMAVIFAASPAAGLPLTAEQVIAYPWGCLEQRMSRAWARAIRLRHGELIGLKADSTDRDAIRDAMASAEKFQKHDGGFALWPSISQSSFYLTTYVLMVNSQTRPLGIALPDGVESQALNYLRSKMRQSYHDKKESRLRQPMEAEAMALWLLARYDQREAQRLYPLTVERAGDGKNINPMTWGALLMAGNAMPDMPGRAEYAARIIKTLEKTAQATPTHLHFASNNAGNYWMTMGSTLRDNGMILGALTDMQPNYPRLEALAAWISQGLGNKTTLSTQEAIYGLWGLTAYLKSLGGNQPVAMTATWNGKETMTKRFTRLIDPPETWTLTADKLAGGTLSGLAFTADKGNPYWSARLTYASPLVPVKDENAGIVVKRAWVKSGGKTGKDTGWKMGDIIDVSVTMIVPATRRHVLLFDPFPAGLEPLHATRVDLANDNRRYQAPWQWEETRNDGMFLYSETVAPGTYTYTYQLRAAAPGTFIQRPSHAEEMYTPEVFGRTAGGTVIVKE